MTPRAISIVVPSYNDEKTLAACLGGVFQHTDHPNWRLIVVDAGSTDGSRAYLETIKDPRLQVILRGREGVAAALNAGFAAAGGDDVVRLHADVVIETPGWLGQLAAAAYAQPKAGVVGARLVLPDGRIQSEGRMFINGVGLHTHHSNLRAFQPDGPSGAVSEVDSVAGALAYYRRSTLEATGGLDANYGPAWMDDDDFCVAARHRGFKVYVHPGVRAVHFARAFSPTFQIFLADSEKPLLRLTYQMKVAAEKRQADHWESKWGWNPFYPDLGEIRRLYSDTEICWKIGEPLRFVPSDRLPTVDCCLVTWNTLGLLRRCLESLAQTDYPADRLRVYVADNASTDGTPAYLEELARSYPFPLHLTRLAVNTGAAIGLNFAIAAGQGELVARLDDDVVLPSAWLKPLVADLVNRPFAGCVGPKIINDDSRQAIQCAGYRQFPVIFGHEDELDLGQADFLARTSHVRGCCNLYRRDVLARCGLFDPRYSPSQGDDPDHHIALIAAGYELLYDGRVRVVHKLNNGLARSHAAIANQAANRAKMLGKWGADIYEVLDRSIDFSREGRYLPDDGQTGAWLAAGPPPGNFPRKTVRFDPASARLQVLFKNYEDLRALARGAEIGQLAESYLKAASLRARDGSPRAALDILLTTVNFVPQKPAVFKALARLYDSLGQPELARLMARRGRALEPSDPELETLVAGAPAAPPAAAAHAARPNDRSSAIGEAAVLLGRPSSKSGAPPRLRVLMVNTFEPRVAGGDMSQIKKTCQYLERLGVQVEVCCTPRPDPRGYDVVHCWNTWFPHQTLAQIKAVRVQRPNVPIVLSPVYWDITEKTWADQAIPELFSESANAAALEVNLRLLALDQFVSHRTNRRTAPEPVHRGYRNYQKRIFELADCLLPQSQAEVQNLKKSLGIEKPYTIVHNAAETAVFDAAKPDWFVGRYGLKDFVLSVGLIEPRKNQLMLLHALKGTNLPVVLVGRHCDHDYFTLCRKFAPPGSLFLEHLPHEHLASAFKAARVHALPSWMECAALVNIEAALCGCPLAISDRTSEKEYFGAGAYYCDPANLDSIRTAVLSAYRNHEADRPRREKLREQFRSRFTWREAARQTLAGYELAIAARAPLVAELLEMPVESVA